MYKKLLEDFLKMKNKVIKALTKRWLISPKDWKKLVTNYFTEEEAKGFIQKLVTFSYHSHSDSDICPHCFKHDSECKDCLYGQFYGNCFSCKNRYNDLRIRLGNQFHFHSTLIKEIEIFIEMIKDKVEPIDNNHHHLLLWGKNIENSKIKD